VVELVVVSTFLVLVLGVLVAGLLRSHADIIRALHDLGAGVGDPAAKEPRPTTASASASGDDAAPGAAPVPTTSTPLGPAPAIAGATPSGDARSIALDHGDQLTLLAFLSSGCATCTGFWRSLQRPTELPLPERTRVVIVTKGADREVPSEVAHQSTGSVPVVMSTEAWLDYEVPGSPFFVLVDGRTGRKVGQGVANGVAQLLELIRRAEHDRGTPTPSTNTNTSRPVSGIDGPAREADVDTVLRAAGIEPGHPSLYPQSLHDVFPARAAVPHPGDVGTTG
jgi:hypothetical protein